MLGNGTIKASRVQPLPALTLSPLGGTGVCNGVQVGGVVAEGARDQGRWVREEEMSPPPTRALKDEEEFARHFGWRRGDSSQTRRKEEGPSWDLA